MNRSSSPRSWFPPTQGGPAPADWYQWPEQPPRGRSPSRDQQKRRSPPPRSYSPPRPISPHPEHTNQRQLSPHPDSKRSLSPRNERPSSPRNEQQTAHRPVSPIRAPSPSRERMPSPRRERPPSPGRERQLSPRRERYSPRDRPPSPGKERPRSPYGWRPRSPPRSHYDWSRRRSPPHWIRRSPPRYVPRSPPRSYWDYGLRPRSPPRWGPPPPLPPLPPPHAYDRRWAGPPGPPPPDRFYPPPPRKMEARPRTPPRTNTDSKPQNKADDYFSTLIDDKDSKDEDFELVELAPYDPDIAIGQKYIVAVSGFFCKVCHKFYNSESSAKVTHCKTRNHYDKFSKWLAEKKVAALQAKRNLAPEEKNSEGPPAKKIKKEPEEVGGEADDTESKYDPTQPTGDVTEKDKREDQATAEEDIKTTEQNGEQNHVPEESFGSDSETLITSGTNKDDGDYIEATLFNLRKLKVNQLKANLENRGMKSTGLKPLLLKRLEKVLADEAAAVAAAEPGQITEEKSEQNADEKGGDDGGEDVGKEYLFKLMESDVEVANRKAQWINEREMERELLQLEGVKKIVSMRSERTRLFNGRRTNVEWTIKLNYAGEVPEEGLKFSIPSHQQLPFVALHIDDDDVV